MSRNARIVAREFFRLAQAAARHGGFWVSAGGGTARVVAAVIAANTGASMSDAMRVLTQEGNLAALLHGPKYYGWKGPFEWYEWLADIQPFRMEDLNASARFDARTIARAAVRAANLGG